MAKRVGWLVGMSLLLLLALILIFGNRGFYQLYELTKSKNELQAANDSLRVEKAALEAEREKLKTDEYTEKIAREKYGMARKNEKVYHVVPKKEGQ